MRVPDWFCKELSFIDPRYYVVKNADTDLFEIKMRLDFARKLDPSHFVRMRNPTIAVFDRLNDTALNSLRRRRRKALERMGGPEGELREIVSRNKEAKQKRVEYGQDQMAEGFMEDYRFNRKHTIS
jgi:hypothetical protein